MAQLSFLFPQNENYVDEDFVFLPENITAGKFLDNFFSQKDFSKSQFPSMILKGEEACGKTHLLNIFARKSAAQFIDHKKISELNLVDFFQENHFYILEDFDKMEDEELLLRSVNSAVEAKAFLILSAKNISKFSLRDLVSRLKNIFVAEIKNPSVESVEQLLANGFARRQIKLSSSEIKSIAKKTDRSYLAISEVISSH